MTHHNTLSRTINILPAWLLQAVVGLFLTSSIAWATWATTSNMKHETRISVTESQVIGVGRSLEEIKAAQKEINQKLDRLIERRGR